ncbi:SH3 domain-containing protein [Sporosarcina sp. FSL K6-3508]|uniref:SH3 domain-containing protein n=1 Tax=Sporosarcina sp. FSL K6-3508 TaxID=2921557 RepID=UPI003159F5AE
MTIEDNNEQYRFERASKEEVAAADEVVERPTDKSAAPQDSPTEQVAEPEAAQWEKDEAVRIADSLQGTNQTIVTGKGNLRNAPTLNGDVITALPRGTEVYIIDTQVESAERIWCKVEVYLSNSNYVGWISYNTMNYTLP